MTRKVKEFQLFADFLKDFIIREDNVSLQSVASAFPKTV